MKNYQVLAGTMDYTGDGMLGSYRVYRYNRRMSKDIVSWLSGFCLGLLYCMGATIGLFFLMVLFNYSPAVEVLKIIVGGFQ